MVLALWTVLLIAWLTFHWFILPHIERWRPALEARASAALGVTVKIGSVQVRSSGWIPAFELHDVQLIDARQRVALRLGRVLAALSPRSLVAFELRFEQLLIDGAELEARRDGQGRISVAGFDFGSANRGDEPSPAVDWFFRQHEFVIRDGTLRWIDESRRAEPLVLERVQLVIRNGLRRHEARLDATPPVAWGDPFTLRGEFTQPLLHRAGDWRRWSGAVYADLPRADVRELRHHVDLPFELSEGHGALRGWFDVHDGQPIGATVDLALRAVSMRLAKSVEPLAFEQIEGRIVASRTGERTSIAVRHFGFVTGDGIRWPAGNLSVAWQQPEGRPVNAGEFNAERLDLGLMAQIASRLPLGAPVRKLLGDVHPEGIVSKLATSWQGPLDAPDRYRVSGSLSELSLASGPASRADAIGRPGLRNATLRLQGTEAGGTARVGISQGALDLPGVFEDPRLPVDQLEANLEWKVTAAKTAGADPLVSVQVKDARFSNADAKVELSAAWHTGGLLDARPETAARRDEWLRQGKKAERGERYPGVLELDGKLSDAIATRTARYLPLGLPDGTRRYIERAVRGGTLKGATIRVRGDLADFPFHDLKNGKRDGEFRVAAQVEGLTFAYVPGREGEPAAAAAVATSTAPGNGPATAVAPEPALGWPAATALNGELVIDNGALEIRDARAMLGGVEWTRLHGGIARLGEHGVLALEGTGRGALADMLSFTHATPIGAAIGDPFAQTVASGNAEMRLALSIPLDGSGAIGVRGNLVLPGNDLRFTPATPQLAGTRTRVDFTQKGFTIAAGTARLLGGEMAFEGASQSGPHGDVQRFSGQGSVAAEAVRKATELGTVSRIASVAIGQAGYRAELSFIKGEAQLSVTSNLVGTAIDLPYPLAKPAATPLALRYQTVLDESSLATGEMPRDTFSLELGSVLQTRYLRELGSTGSRVLRGHVRVSDAAMRTPPVTSGFGSVIELPTSGVTAQIELRQLDALAWEAALDKLFGDESTAGVDASANAVASGAATRPPRDRRDTRESAGTSYQPERIALRVLDLKAGARHLGDVVAGVSQQNGLWRANVDSDDIDGYVEYRPPRRATGAGRVYARLSRLSLPKADADPVETLLEQPPSSVPALDIVADGFELRGWKLGRLEVEAANRLIGSGSERTTEWQLSKFNLTVPEAQLTASGTWSATRNAGPASRRASMNFRLELADSGGLLDRLGMVQVIKGGKGEITGEIAWPGSPLSPTTKGMEGQVRLAIDSGQFLKASAGAARLLGVLSLQSLPRRLTFDFRDLFQDGFAFDNIVGDVKIGYGLATTNNFRMRGAAAAVLMDGSADLDRETEELRVVVVPEINAGTASLAYAIINPAVGLGTFLAQVLLRKPLAAAGTREFRVSGPWEDPKVDRVEHRPDAQAEAAGATAPAAASSASTSPTRAAASEPAPR